MRVNFRSNVEDWPRLEARVAAGHRLWHAGDPAAAYQEWHAATMGRWTACRRAGLDLLQTRALTDRFVQNIGHFIYLDAYLKLVKLGLLQARNVCLPLEPGARVSNRALLDLYAEHLTVRESGPAGFPEPVRSVLGWLREDLDYVRIDDDRGMSIYDAAVWAHQAWSRAGLPPLIRTTPAIDALGAAFLARHGAPPGGWFVGLHVRTAGYNGPSVRDARIEDCEPLVRRLLSWGATVVRMGDPTMPPAPRLEGVIDYAHSAERDPRLDVFFLSRCRFFVAGTSGLGYVSTLFDVPIIFLNWAPLVCSPVKAENWYLPKRYRRLGTGEVVSQRELLARGLGPVEFEHALRGHGLEVEDNAPEEIVEAVSHFYAHVVQGQALPSEDAEVQRSFAEAARRAGVVGAGTVAPGFARRHPEAW